MLKKKKLENIRGEEKKELHVVDVRNHREKKRHN